MENTRQYNDTFKVLKGRGKNNYQQESYLEKNTNLKINEKLKFFYRNDDKSTHCCRLLLTKWKKKVHHKIIIKQYSLLTKKKNRR